MTPIQMWEGYNPVKDPLETYIQKCNVLNDIAETEMYFTAESLKDGKIRVYSKMYAHKDWDTSHPAVLFLSDLNASSNYVEISEMLVEQGYVVFVVDYAGFMPDVENPTSFPDSLKYASFEEAKHNLKYMGESARQTPWFVWAKIARRAITLMEEQKIIDNEKINVVGFIHGAQLAWIVAAMDGRVNAAVPVMGCGHNSYGAKEVSVLESEEECCWVSGICPETYARFVGCPILYATSTNSLFANLDKAGEIMASVPSKNKCLVVAPRTNYQLTKESLDSILLWANSAFKGECLSLPSPKASFKISDGRLLYSLDTELEPAEIETFISFDNVLPPIRDWFTLPNPYVGQKVNYIVTPYDNTEKIFAFSNVKYKNGLMVSTSPVFISKKEFEDVEKAPAVVENNRIVYTNKSGLGSFSIESYSLIVDDAQLKLKTGPFGIKGVSAESGYIRTNKLTKSKFAAEKNSILKIDFYSKEPRDIRIQLFSFNTNKAYVAKCFLKGGERWQKVLLTPQDFKSDDGKPLTLFSDTQITLFKNVASVIINNIIWI